MADTIILSTADANMVDYPLAIQAASGDTAIEYGAQEHMRHLLAAIFESGGRLQFGEFRAVQRSAGANFSVDVTAGFYVITGSSSPAVVQGRYLVHTLADVNVPTPSAPASGTRVHRLVAQVLDKVSDGGSSYGWRFWLREDTGSGTPAIPPNAEHVCLISISAGQVNVLNQHITNDLTAVSVARGGLGMIYTKEYDTTGTTLFTGAPGVPAFTGMSMDAYVVSGNRYTVRFRVRHDNTTNAVTHLFAAFAGNSATDVDQSRKIGDARVYIQTAGGRPVDTLEFDYEATSTGTVYFNLGIAVSGGTGSVYRGLSNDRTWITLEDNGPAKDRFSRVTGA